ncbi:hypothetical protein KSB_83120 [Ktedonobacter robiniae]|uniref:Uncharacterized protein n=1 Tax=Ktedonobacter robiniae TaxID=2778365 RepID=A0ABQ3V4Z0_9CHLR|nr:hypothetical protein KSB_83120 [Ktedonobacter robiniae]
MILHHIFLFNTIDLRITIALHSVPNVEGPVKHCQGRNKGIDERDALCRVRLPGSAGYTLVVK